MSATEEARTEPKIGSRVKVTSADGSRELGYGTYMGEVLMKDVLEDLTPSSIPVPEPVEVTDEERAEAGTMVEQLTENGATTPKIVLDSGETVYGFQCWWSVEDDPEAIN